MSPRLMRLSVRVRHGKLACRPDASSRQIDRNGLVIRVITSKRMWERLSSKAFRVRVRTNACVRFQDMHMACRQRCRTFSYAVFLSPSLLVPSAATHAYGLIPSSEQNDEHPGRWKSNGACACSGPPHSPRKSPAALL